MSTLTTSAFTQTYTSFSGVDVVAIIGGFRIAEIQGISYSITREKAPVYTMGSANPRSFSRGKRGIAGSMVFIMFDRNALYNLMQASQYVAHSDENAVRVIQNGQSALTLNQLDNNPNVVAYLATPIYADQIPPFDISLTGANEVGQIATMSIYGCEFLNEGSGISVDDIVNEQAFTYVAQDMKGWTPVQPGNTGISILDLGGSVNLATIPELNAIANT